MLPRLLIIVGLVILAIGGWLIAPIVRVYATDQTPWGRILDTIIMPAGDGLARFQVVFEYPVPGSDGRTWAQGISQADGRMVAHEAPIIPLAQALTLRQRFQEQTKRRVFLPVNRPGAEPFIISEAVATGFGYRHGLFIALAGSLLITMGITSWRQQRTRGS